MKIFNIMAWMTFVAASSTAFAGFDEGIEAYTHGDFETALSTFRPLAEDGVPARNITLLWLNDSGHPDRALSFAQQ